MERIVMKFGGTSVGSKESILNLISIIKQNLEENPIVVVSAVGGVTDMILDGARKAFLKEATAKDIIKKIRTRHEEILKGLGLDISIIEKNLNTLMNRLDNLEDLSKKRLDDISSFGERMSSKIISAALNKEGIESTPHNAYQIGLITDSNFGSAEPLETSFKLIRDNIADMKGTPIITGFIGKDKEDNITTLGRGGSDYSAAIIGKAIHAKRIEIWTDVDGMMTTDPRIFNEAKKVNEITFDEAAELAFFGAKVLHPRTILPAVENNIPIEIKNTLNPTNAGTKILKEIEYCNQPITAISIKKNIKIIRVCSSRMLNAHGFMARIFSVFEKHRISVDMVSTSEVSVSITLEDSNDHSQLILDLMEFSKVQVFNDMNLICIVGRCLHKDKTIHGEIFSCLEEKEIPIRMISQGASRINISFVVSKEYGEKAIRLIHGRFM